MITIHTTNVSASFLPTVEDFADTAVMFPETWNHKGQTVPRTPAEVVSWMKANFPMFLRRDFEDVDIVTIDECVILYVLKAVAQTYDEDEQLTDPCPLTNIRIVYYNEDGNMELRIDKLGEFVDRWPGGFFRERGDLLFY